MAKCTNSRIIVGSVPLEVVSSVGESLICSICYNVLSDPQQTPCGCRFCLDCISKYLQQDSKMCPGGTNFCELLNLSDNVRSDTTAKREILKLVVKCPSQRCHTQCIVGQIERHMGSCACRDAHLFPNLNRHKNKELKQDSIGCSFCGVEMKVLLMETVHHNFDHADLCEKYEDHCPNECGEAEKVCWKTHARTCKGDLLSCPYEKFGCETKLRKIEMKKHFVEGAFHHTEMLLEHIDNMNNEMRTMKTELEKIGRSEQHHASTDIVPNSMPLMSLIASIGSRVDDIDRKVTFYNGNFRWIMMNYDLNQRGTRPSQTFYTDERGYRMQLELSTDDQRGFLSVCAKIWRGDFDNELRWPFDQRVTIRILDQERRGRNYAKSINFNNSPNKCRKKPNRNFNESWGELAFIRLDDLESKEHLFCDEEIWIDCFVDDD